MEKRIVLVDEKDNILGYKEKFTVHKNPVPLHRAISVVIFSPDKLKMLIQKRARYKPTWPLFWSNTVCSHPFKNESYEAAAIRRLKEEMGFSTPLTELFRFEYQAKYDKTWGEHELDTVFEGEYNGTVKPDPDEVSDYKWIGIEKLKKEIIGNPEKFTPWFNMILKRIV